MIQDALPWAGVSLAEKIDYAIAVLQTFEPKALQLDPERGYWLANSGGKDSGVIADLIDRSGVRHVKHYNVCPDPPELQHFLKHAHPTTIWDRPEHTLFWYIPKKGLPSFRSRWCCELFKEKGGDGLLKVCGIRAAESPRRKHMWEVLTALRRTSGWMLNPILHWTSQDVWDYTHDRNLSYCELYDEVDRFGRTKWKRLGCVGCPMARSQQARQFDRWPRIKALWRKATHKLWERRAGTKQRDGREWYASAFFSSADEYFQWWYSAKSLPKRTTGHWTPKWDETTDEQIGLEWISGEGEGEAQCQMGLW